jgi:hypothetical protein
VLRFSSLSTDSDYAYGTGFEYLSFDSQARPLIRLTAPYVKLLPVTLDDRHKVLVLMRALDRRDENERWEPEWFLGEGDEFYPAEPASAAQTRAATQAAQVRAAQTGDAQIVLDISYEDFLILFRIRRGLSNLSIGELFSASKTIGTAGYIPHAFNVEILNRLGAVLFFLPLTIAALIIGWRFRAKNRPRYLFIPMLAVLPIVFHGVTRLYQTIFANLGIWLILSLDFSWALTIFIASAAALFVFLLIALAAQRG